MIRTGSAKSTLSMMQRSATRYEKYITLASVFLIITSTIVIFTSVVLIKWYFMPNLSFWAEAFLIAPYLMLALGIYKFVISLYGFAITSSENRGLLIFFAVLLIIAFIAQVASIFVFWQVKEAIKIGNAGTAEAHTELSMYGKNGSESITRSWDHMQQHLHCCGANNDHTGYTDWKNTDFGRKGNSVPSSCCYVETENCGQGILSKSEVTIRKTIFADGCLVILQQWMQEDVAPMIGVYTAVGLAIALVELIAAVLVFAYVAQIARRRQREDMIWSAVRPDDHHDGGHEMTHLNTMDRTSNHDTQV